MKKYQTLLLIDYILSGLNAVYSKQDKGDFEPEYLKTKLRRFVNQITVDSTPEKFLETLESLTADDLRNFNWSA